MAAQPALASNSLPVTGGMREGLRNHNTQFLLSRFQRNHSCTVPGSAHGFLHHSRMNWMASGSWLLLSHPVLFAPGWL